MNKLAALAVVCVIASAVSAETGLSGRWVTAKNVQPRFIMQLNSSGTAVTGTVQAVDGDKPIVMEVVDGKVAGNRVTFKTTVPEAYGGPYPILFTGHRAGDTLTFKCDVEVNPPGEKVVLGPACLQKVTVRRVSQ